MIMFVAYFASVVVITVGVDTVVVVAAVVVIPVVVAAVVDDSVRCSCLCCFYGFSYYCSC